MAIAMVRYGGYLASVDACKRVPVGYIRDCYNTARLKFGIQFREDVEYNKGRIYNIYVTACVVNSLATRARYGTALTLRNMCAVNNTYVRVSIGSRNTPL